MMRDESVAASQRLEDGGRFFEHMVDAAAQYHLVLKMAHDACPLLIGTDQDAVDRNDPAKRRRRNGSDQARHINACRVPDA